MRTTMNLRRRNARKRRMKVLNKMNQTNLKESWS